MDVFDTASPKPIDIEVPEDKHLYPETIVARVKEIFATNPYRDKIVFGIDLGSFSSRREEYKTGQLLKDAGFKMESAHLKSESKFFPALVTRIT